MTQLIGTTNWDPTGESMWSIIAKLSKLNYLSWAETRRIFGAKELRSFSDENACDPDILTNFNLPKTSLITDLPLSVFKSAFSEAYLPALIKQSKRSTYNSFTNSTLRVCHTCFSQGVHLCLHQMMDWLRCPIHHETLTSCCKGCGEKLQFYSIHVSLSCSFECHNCGYVFWGKNYDYINVNQDDRLKVIKEYQKWTQKINLAFDDPDYNFRWLNKPSVYSDLAFIHQIIPGPKWFNDCFVNVKSVRNTKIYCDKFSIKQAPYVNGKYLHKLIKINNNYHPINHKKELSPLKLTLGNKLSLRIRAINRYIIKYFKTNNLNYAVYELNSELCIPKIGEDVTAWDSGYWLWRRCVDSAFPCNLSWNRRREKPSFFESFVWESWAKEPGGLLWSQSDDYRSIYNFEFVNWLTDYWVKQFYLETYFKFVAVACRCIGEYGLYTDRLESQTERISSNPMWILEQKGNGIVVNQLSIIAPTIEFKNLQKANFRGTDYNYFKDFKELVPLIKLLNMCPQERREWYKSWSQIKNYLIINRQQS